MHEKTLKLAAAISQASAGEMPLLEALCAAAEADLSGRLREEWTPERCGDAFSCAAAMVTAAGMLTCRANGGGAAYRRRSESAAERKRDLRDGGYATPPRRRPHGALLSG